MKQFFQKYIFGKHHGIERFGLSFVSLLICLLMTTSFIMVRSFDKRSYKLTTQAVYTTSFQMSRSQVQGEVTGVFTSADHTKSLLLLKFDDVSKISIDANNYTLFLRGWDINKNERVPLDSNPSGAIYMLGTTGYMAIYMADTSGFENQVCYLTIRNDKELVDASKKNVNIDKVPSEQYADYDLADIYFNPGATGATIADCLSQDVFTMRDMYEECVVRTREANLRTLLDADLRAMKADLILISEYTQRVASYGIALNAPDDVIKDDYIVNGKGEIVATMDPAVKMAAYTEGEPLYLMSDYICKGGVHFDWYNGSIYNGYIDVLRKDKTPQEYVNELVLPVDIDKINTDVDWYYASSGQIFELVSGTGGFTNTTVAISKSINDLTGAWNTYLSHKKQYQSKTLISLLELDYEVMLVDSNYTVNNSADSFRVTR